MAGPKRIKPFVKEISLAKNPIIQKTFYMVKEEIMSKSVEILQDKELKLSSEKEMKKVIKDMAKEYQPIFLDGLKLLQSCKDVPKACFSLMSDSSDTWKAWTNEPIDLEKERTKMEKEITTKLTAKLREEVKKDMNKTDNEEIKTLKDNFTVMEKTLKDTQKELKVTTKELSDEKTSRQLLGLEKDAVDLGAVGEDIKSVAKTLMLLDKTDPKGAEIYRKQMQAAKDKIDSLGLFDEFGSAGAGAGAGDSGAYDFLQKEVNKIVQKSDDIDIGKARENAWKAVRKTFPEKYSEYLTDRQSKE